MPSPTTYHHLPILDGLELLEAHAHTLDFPFHQHETLTISLILDTTFKTKLTDHAVMSPPGTITITNPNEVHATPCDKDYGNSFFTFYISPEAVRHLCPEQEVYFANRVIHDPALFHEMYQIAAHISTAADTSTAAHLGTATDNLEPALGTALQKLVTQYASPATFSGKTRRLFQAFIDEIPTETFSLDKTAAQFGMGKYKFIRLFKQETGLTPNNFVLWKRIENSKTLLKTGMPIFDTAIKTGFYDQSHFYRNFKRFIGVTPLEFQKSRPVS